MKKVIISVFVGALFIAYIIYQRVQTSSSTNPSALAIINNANSNIVDTSQTNNPVIVNSNNTRGSSSGSTNSSGKTSAGSSSGTTSTGQYKNGTYTGIAADAYYGNVQVKATISGGKLTAIEFLQYPNDRGHSVEINSYALPKLRSEAIANQSAQVDIVSGATDSSEAFMQSLASALSQAS